MLTAAQRRVDMYAQRARELVGLAVECGMSIFHDHDACLFDALAGESTAIKGASVFVCGSGVVEFQGVDAQPLSTPGETRKRRWSVTMGSSVEQVVPASTELCSWGIVADGYVISLGALCDGEPYEVMIFGEDDAEVRVAGVAGNSFKHVRHLERWARSHDVDRLRQHLRDAQRDLHDPR